MNISKKDILAFPCIHEGRTTLIFLHENTASGTPVVIKMLRHRHAVQQERDRLANEFELTRDLHIQGVRRALEYIDIDGDPALILEYVAGETLSKTFADKDRSLQKILAVACSICRTLDELHSRRFIHRNISSTNILADPDGRAATIIDFGSALKFDPKKNYEYPGMSEVSPQYIAPEQTGRINRPVDYRADLYSLGVVLYEVLTGKLPFAADNIPELIHCHIAKHPTPVCEVNIEVPRVIADIVTKLMAKNPDERYQSAFGLKCDLEKCLRGLLEHGKIQPFALAKDDVSAIFRIPKKMYGRKHELDTLFEAIEEAAAGRSGILFIAGNEGVGKTALVDEVRPYIAGKRGYIVAGRYDEREKNIPYHAFIQAITGLVDLIMTQNEAQMAQWTAKIKEALGDSGALLTEVIPTLELVIGKQPPALKLATAERQNRFFTAFQRLIKSIGQEGFPLVLFLDNLQWADYASLDLLKLLAKGSGNQFVLLIGAYRDSEVGPAHPLTAAIEYLQQTNTAFRTVQLENFSRNTLNDLISDTLKCDPDYVRSLSDLVFEKTGGNALFAIQFFQSLHDEGLLSFVGYLKHWEWDTEQIRALAITDNVVSLMTRKIGKLPAKTQELLSLAACIGNSFNLSHLAAVAGLIIDDTRNKLHKAVEEGFILQADELRRIKPAEQDTDSGDCFTFLHDRVRQVSYSLLSRKKRKTAHLKIGLLLLSDLQESEKEKKVFTIADHLNEGFQYLDTEEQRSEMIHLNLIAGRKANRAAAYKAAIWYLSMGIGMLPADKWDRCYELAFHFYMEAVEAEYLSTNYERSELLSAELLRHVKDDLAKVKVYEMRILLFTAQNRNAAAIQAGIDALSVLGIYLPTKLEGVQAYTEEIRKELSTEIGPDKDLARLPVLHDADQLAARRILMNLAGPAHQSNPELLSAITLYAVLQSIWNGNSPMSALAYGWYAVLLCGPYNDIEQCYRFGRLSLAVLEQFKTQELEPRVLFLYNVLVRHWKKHAGESVKALEDIYLRGLATGDLEYTYYAAVHACSFLFCVGGSLQLIRGKQLEYLEATERFRLEFHCNFAKIWAQTVQNLIGCAGDPCRLSGELFDEAGMLPVWIEQNNPVLVFNTLCCKAMLQYLFGKNADAVASARLGESYVKGGEGYIYIVQYYYYYALALLANFPDTDAATQKKYLIKIEEIEAKMKEWARNAPMNFQHKYDLIQAEKARVTGETLKAMGCYNRAILGAGKHGYLQEEALSYEREALFHFAMGREDLAGFDIRKAVEGYRLWGALRKVDDLQRRYRTFLEKEQPVPLDTAAVINASHLLSQEIKLDHLLDKMMHIVMENAGAEKGILLENRDGRLIIQAKGEIGRNHIVTMQETPVGENGEVPLSVVNYVARTQTPVVLNDAFRDHIYAFDNYIVKNHTRSLLCLPIVHQGRLSGLLYLENNLATNVFTPDRLELLKAISSQAAISMENAGLYADLEATIKELKQAEAAVRDSQSLLKAIVDNSTAVISVKDLRGRYLLINRRFEELFHISQKSALGKTDFDIFPKNTADAFQTLDRQALDRGKAIESEEVVSHDDGLHTYISIKCPLFNNEGKPYAVFGISTDISERKRAAEALGESERKFRAIFEQTFQFIGLMTVDGILIAANKAALELVGLEESDIVGKPFWDTPWWAHSMELQEELRTAVKRAGTGEFVRFEASHPAMDGSLRYVDFSLKPVKDDAGKVVLLIPEGRDITERKEAEVELKKHRDHLDELVRQRTAEVTEANELLRREVAERRKIEEALNRRLVALTEPLETADISFADLFNIDDIQRIQDSFAEALDVASIITYPDGTPITGPSHFCRLCNDIIRKTEKGKANCMFSDSVISRQNPDGPIIQPCLSGGLWDAGASITIGGKHLANWLIGQVKNEGIDEEKLLACAAEIGADEDEFRRALQEVPVMSPERFDKIAHLLYILSNELSLKAYQNVQQARFITARRQAEKDLVVAKELAEAANQAKSTFLSSMSHELRTPLNAILGYAQILKHQENLTETQLQQLEIMHSSGEHLLMLINDILDVGKIELWKMQRQEETFHLASLLRQVFNITRIKTDEKDLLFHYEELDPLPEYVRGDERKLKQILLNLLGNAVKYTRRGHITLRVSYGRAGPELFRCEVSDTGIGIPHDKLEAIFEPFTQLASEGQPHEGTGLGLTITRQLVNLIEGRLGVESESTKGSTFWFEAPMIQVDETQITVAKTQWNITGYQGERKKILIVDDNIANASMLVSLLAPLGFEISTAKNGSEALHQAIAQPPDLVILDLVMPEMDGLETVVEMRRHPKLDATWIIGVSATVTESSRKEDFIAACNDFIGKPVDIEMLLEKIRSALHIEWEIVQPHPVETAIGEKGEEGLFEVPSPEKMAELHELAMRGDLRGIQAWADKIEEEGGRSRRFVARLRELTGRFKTKAVLALVEQYMPKIQ